MGEQSTNVVCLPTAAPRKVDNFRYTAQRRAGIALRKAQPWPGEHMFPGEREAELLAAQLVSIKRTPALELVSAMLTTLSGDAKERVRLFLLLRKAVGSKAAEDALAIVKSTNMTIGAANDLRRALDRMEAGI